MKTNSTLGVIIKIFLGRLILTVAFLVGVFILIKTGTNDWTEIKNKYAQQLGAKVIINHDTLTIIDYSVINRTYKLDNGTNVSADYVIKYKIK